MFCDEAALRRKPRHRKVEWWDAFGVGYELVAQTPPQRTASGRCDAVTLRCELVFRLEGDVKNRDGERGEREHDEKGEDPEFHMGMVDAIASWTWWGVVGEGGSEDNVLLSWCVQLL